MTYHSRVTASLRVKLVVLLVAVSLAAAGSTALIVFVGGSQALKDAAFDELTAIRETKASHVEDYFGQIREQVVRFSEDRMVVDAFVALSDGFFENEPAGVDDRFAIDTELDLYYTSEFIPRIEEVAGHTVAREYQPLNRRVRDFQHLFIAANPNPTGEKDKLDDPGDGSSYAEAHSLYHPLMRNFQQGFGFYDVFLIDAATGNIIYSVFKEIDFATSLEVGPHRGSGLADVFNSVKNADVNDPQIASLAALEDFRPYDPSYGAPASFIASPIIDDGELIGVLAFQMPVDRISEIMTSEFGWREAGLGDSGETYIVGSDSRLRSESRFLVEDKTAYLEAIRAAGLPVETVNAIETIGSAIGLQPVETQGVAEAMEGTAGTDTFDDYRDVLVLSSFRPLDIEDVDWVILSEVDEAEAFSEIRRFRNQAILWLTLVGIAIVAVAAWYSRRLIKPIKSLSAAASAMAAGDLEAQVEIGGSDEIAELAQSFDTMRVSIVDLVERQDRVIEALTTPLIPMGDGIVVLPMVGELDHRRMASVGEELVDGVHQQRARAVMVDMTGMSTTDDVDNDDGALHTLLNALDAVGLLGVMVVLTGVQADMATRFTALDHDMTGLITATTLRQGIERANTNLDNPTSPASAEGQK